MAVRAFAVFFLVVPAVTAQSVRVYSEFQRIDPSGAVVAADRAERPREVLSPLLPRNAYTSFHVVVDAPEGQKHTLFIAQNPENAVEVTMYREVFVKSGESWIPDGLEKVDISEYGGVPDIPPQAPGQHVEVYWMDVRVAPDAYVRRTRLEVQLNTEGHWIIYPMELRIWQPVVPASAAAAEPLAAIDAPASRTAFAALRSYLCNGGTAAAPAAAAAQEPLTIRGMIRRNALQDVAWAASIDAKSRPDLLGGILKALGTPDLKAFCQAPAPPQDAAGAEWYLRVRDLLYRAQPRPAAPAK
jgi:hypothetical protein